MSANGTDDGDHREVVAPGEAPADRPHPSHYERIGGGPAIRTVVDRFYRLVLDDEELRPYFEVDMARLKRHQAALLTQVLGGPAGYQGRDLGKAHAGLAITGAHYRKVVNYLTGVLWITQVPSDVISDVAGVLASAEAQIVGADRELDGDADPGIGPASPAPAAIPASETEPTLPQGAAADQAAATPTGPGPTGIA